MTEFNKKVSTITIYDVAREAGFSYATVSRVFNGAHHVKESTRERVIETAKRLGYVANQQARSLAGGKSAIIGLLVPALDNGYFVEVLRGIDLEIARAHYDLMLYTTHRNHGKESEYVQLIANGLSDGLLLIVPTLSSAYLEILREKRFPYVLIDQNTATVESPVVDATNWQGAYDATTYLIELGHRRIGFITGLMNLSSAVDRLEGYKAALHDHNIPLYKNLILEGDFLQETGSEKTRLLLEQEPMPTAIFASNDLMAFGALEAIREAGLSVPRDLSVIGFDDLPQASLVLPKLTTVRQPLEKIGSIAVQLLLEQIENPERQPRRVTVATELIVRDSCQPPKR